MAIYQPSKNVLLDAINAQNSLTIKLTDIVFSAPKDIRGTEKGTTTGKNTQIKVSAAPVGSTWSGKKNVYYNRLSLADLPVLLGTTIAIGASMESIHPALTGLNNRYGFVFDTDDLEDSEIEWNPDGLTGTVLLKAKADSLGWVGQQQFSVVKGDESLESSVTTNVLTGLKYPNGQMGSETPTSIMAQVYSYPFDFTKYQAALMAMTPQVISGQVLTDMTNLLKDITATAWVATTASTFGLAGAEILSVGLNDAVAMPTNVKYKYVLVLKLPATTTNITGNLYLQFNDLDDPNEV